MQTRVAALVDLEVILKRIKSTKFELVTILRLLAGTYFDDNTGCWFRNKDWSIYTRVGSEPAHRISYELFTGFIIGSRKEICHHCDRKGCFNPDHLFEGTFSDNIQDAIDKGRLKVSRGPKSFHNPEERKQHEKRMFDIRERRLLMELELLKERKCH